MQQKAHRLARLSSVDNQELKKYSFERRQALNEERDIYREDWMDLSDYVLGARGRFLGRDLSTREYSNSRRNERLYNETPKQAANTLASGMLAGITSPARPWFKLTTPDPDMEEYEPVRLWLSDVQRLLLTIYAKSNFYGSMWNVYLEMGTFGTTAVGAYENFDKVMRYEPYTIGSFALGQDGHRNIDTMYREYELSVGELVKRFGIENVSRAAKNLWDRGNLESKVNVLHCVEPNTDRDFESPLAKNMPYRSVYFENGDDRHSSVLKLSGFEDKPFMAPRWMTIAEDVYSTSYPGIDSLASNKSLQIEELDKAIAIEKMHNPPLVGDSALKQSGADLIAGGITYTANMAASGKPGLAPVYDVNPRVAELVESIREKERRIERFYYADLFLMLANLPDQTERTMYEIAERKEEKMLMLGPVLERLNNELLDPNIDRTFNVAQRAGILPPAPEELEDVELGVEYLGILAQAQKAISTTATESTVAFAGNLAASGWPQALHKIDPMQAVDEYARSKGANPKIIRGDTEAQESADAEAAQIQAQQAAAMAGVGVDAVKTMSETDMSNDDSMLSALTGIT